jgi:predicted esterase
MMQEHSLPVQRTARYFTLGEPSDAGDRWFVCHGYGQLAARFLERFRPIEKPNRCIVAPEGLSRFYLSEGPAERRVGASWMTREDRLHEIDDYVRYLDALHEATHGAHGMTTALGFSQGTATVCRWAAYGSARLDRLILWGGEVPPDLDIGDKRVLEKLAASQLTLVYGTRDAFFTTKVVAANETRLKTHDLAYELISFDGGHELHEPTLRKLAP